MSVVDEWSRPPHGGAEDDLPGWMERDFDRRAFIPRLAVLLILLLGALSDYGHGHRAGHWIVLLLYGLGTLAAAVAARSRSGRLARWLPLAATAVDALIAVYVIVDHVPRYSRDARLATDAISLLPAFLFLLQTGLRLRPGLIALFSLLVAGGWLGTLIVFLQENGAASDTGNAIAVREGLSLAAFLAASGFVLYAAVWMRAAARSAVRAREERLLLSRFLPESIALDVVRGGETSAIAERHATILSVDLRGSSALAREYPPAQFADWLLRFRSLVHDTVTAEGGVVDKYIGDGVLALFLDGTQTEQAERAVATMRAVFQALTRWNVQRERNSQPRLRVIASAHCGHVLAGVFDDGRRAEFTVLGPVMNDLSRIERRAKEADIDIVVSATLAQHLSSDPAGTPSIRLYPLPSRDPELPQLFALRPAAPAEPRSDAIAPAVRIAMTRLPRFAPKPEGTEP